MKKEEKRTKLVSCCTYQVMDACNMSFEDNSFDLVFEKGTVDAFISNGKQETGENEGLNSLLKEVYRVLKPSGKYLIISGNDRFLLDPYLHNCELDWIVEYEQISTKKNKAGTVYSTHFFYLLTKQPEET